MDANAIKKATEQLLNQLKPSRELLDAQISQLPPEDLALLSPILEQINKDKSALDADELIKLGNDILKNVKNANESRNNK